MSGDQDNDDILDTGDLGGDPGFEDFDTGSRQSFQDVLKNNPTMKLGLVIGAVVLIAGGVMLFGGDKEDKIPVRQSQVARPSDVKETPGMKEVSKGYEEALVEKNEQNLTQALQQGGSAIPVPIGPAKSRLEVQTTTSTEDPLERWKRVQEERMRKEKEAQAASQSQAAGGVPGAATPQRAPDPYAEDKQNLADSLASQMESILEAQAPKKSRLLQITDPKMIAEERQRLATERAAAQMQTAAAEAAAAAGIVEILLPAGRIEYGQLVIEANSDVPGPVLAELASGPLAGSRLIGSFTKTKEYISIQFSTIVVKGVALSTQAIAIDPATSKPGMVTEIDRRYFERVILPAAAAFIKGLGGAIAESGSTTVSAGAGTTTSASNDLDARQEFFKGVEEAADRVGQILEQDRVEPLLRVAAGTHIGILFLKSVESKPQGGTGPVAQTTVPGVTAPAGAMVPGASGLAVPQGTAPSMQ
jgi:intracellular multiplication protein IcmE